MRRLISLPLVILLSTLLHVDWHFARSHHHRLSLEWSSHWLFGILFFALTGWYVARRWPARPWLAASLNVGLALFGAQLFEPLAEVAIYDHRLGYDVEPERWVAFAECVGAGIPALMVALWLSLRLQVPRTSVGKLR